MEEPTVPTPASSIDKSPLESKKFWAFLITDFVLVGILAIASVLKTAPDLAQYIVSGVVVSGLGMIFGQGAVDAVQIYMTNRLTKPGKTE